MPQDLQEQSQAPATDVSRYQPPVPARLVVQGSSFPLPFPGGKSEWIVGREDPISGKFPDFDLTDHGGDELGVSREHARISKRGEQFFVEDLQSTNYTFVNQQQLQPGQSHPLSDGDELCFGRLKLNFYLS
jgi:pSer/pThr/pTyr-binding forkhead associated (FHA) protein